MRMRAALAAAADGRAAGLALQVLGDDLLDLNQVLCRHAAAGGFGD
jgi:hypothetical protein